MMQDTTW